MQRGEVSNRPQQTKPLRIRGRHLRSRYLPLHCGSDLLVMTEQVCRLVFVLQAHKPIVINPVGRLDALRAFLGLKADLIDVVAAGGERTHRLCQLACPPDVHVICRRVQPARLATPLPQGASMAKRSCGSVYPVRRVAQLLEEGKRMRRRDRRTRSASVSSALNWLLLDTRSSSSLPSGLAQALDQVGVIFRPKPRHAIADVHVKGGRRERDRFLQRFLRFCNATELAERGGRPAIDHREIGVGQDQPLRCFDRASYSREK